MKMDTLTFFPALEASHSPPKQPDSEPSAMPKLNRSPALSITDTSPEACALAESRTSRAIQSLSDAVNSRLSFLEDFLANRTALQGSEKPLPTKETCGVNASECLATYDPATHFLKTSQACLLLNLEGSSIESLATWPRFGMLVSGKLYPLPTLERHTAGNESGCSASTNWPTSSSRDWKDSPGMSKTGINPDGSVRNRDDQLARAVFGHPLPDSGPAAPANRSSDGSRPELLESAWPTPRAGNPGSRPNEKGGKILAEEVKKEWSTPQVHDTHGRSNNQKQIHGTKHGCRCLVQDVKSCSTPNTLDSMPPKSPEAIQREMTEVRPGRTQAANLRDQVAGNWQTFAPGSCGRGGRPSKAIVEAIKNGDKPNLQVLTVDQVFQHQKDLSGKLNPHWVATLMGYPPLWCEIGRKFTTASRSSKDSATQ